MGFRRTCPEPEQPGTGKRIRSWWLLLGLTGVLPGCETNESSLEVYYQVWDLEQQCYQTCGAVAPPADLGLGDSCTTDPGVCDIVPGETSLRVIALYRNVWFDEPLTAPRPTLTAFVDGEAWSGGSADAVEWIPHQRAEHEAWFEVYRSLPYVGGDALWFRVLASDDFFQDSVRFRLRAPELSVVVSDCLSDSPCELPAGLGQATVHIEGPLYLEHPLLVWERLDGVKVAGTEQEVNLEDAGGTRGAVDLGFSVPDTASTVWEIVVQLDTLGAASSPITIRAPNPIEVGVSATEPTLDTATFSGTPQPERAAGDLDSCRKLYLAIHAPDRPPGGMVQVSTSLGTLEGEPAGNPVSLALDGDGFATALLEWDTPEDGTRTVEIVAEADSLDSRRLSFDLAPVYPDSARLLPPTAPVPVSATGSAASLLTGWFVPPEGTTVSPDAGYWLVVEAVATSDDNATPCGTPVTSTHVRCDPGRLAGDDVGGCLLTPEGLNVSDDGTFNISLASGVCFVGDVTVSVYGYRYLDSEGCLGARSVSAVPERLADVVVTYAPSTDATTPTPSPPTPTPSPGG